MNVSLAKAHGAPCPTAVLDGRSFPNPNPNSSAHWPSCGPT